MKVVSAMQSMSKFLPFVRPIGLAFLGGILIGSAWMLYLDGTLKHTFMPTLVLFGSIVALLAVSWGAVRLIIMAWLHWRQAHTKAWRWLVVAALIPAVLSYLAIMFILDQGLGAKLRQMPMIERLPEGNLMVVAGPYAWTFVGVVVVVTVMAFWPKLVAYPSKLKTAWGKLPKRVKTVSPHTVQSGSCFTLGGA